MYNLASLVEHNVNKRVERRVGELLLRQAVAEVLGNSSLGHVLSEVTNDGADSANFLDDVAQVVNEEVQRRAALGDGAKKTVHNTDDVANNITDQARDVVDGVNEQRVQVKRLEDTVDNINEVTCDKSACAPAIFESYIS